jgi:hypothetical protein
MTPSGIDPATFRFVAQCLNHCATACPMYQCNDRLTQLFTKYKYIWLWLQCFDPYLGHGQVYIIKLEGAVHG